MTLDLTRKTILSIGLIGGLFGGGFAVAYGADGHNMEQKFTQSDLDQDGFLTLEELIAARQVHFNAMDENQDGLIQESEISAIREAEGMGSGRQGHQARMLKRLDENGDGMISAEEFSSHGPERMIAKMDTDGDGRLSRDEMQTRPRGNGMNRGMDGDHSSEGKGGHGNHGSGRHDCEQS